MEYRLAVMKKSRNETAGDDLGPEYTKDELGQGTRGKYLQRYRTGTNVVVLSPDVVEAFPTEEAVNEDKRINANEPSTSTMNY